MGNYYCKEVKFKSSLQSAWEKTLAILEFLNWRFEIRETNEIKARVWFSGGLFGEYLTISFPKEHLIRVESESINPFQYFDLGKNEANVEKFIIIFKKGSLPLEESDFAHEKKRSFLDRLFSLR